MKRKRKPRELTQYQLDQRAYSAFRHQAYLRTLAPHIAYTDPTEPQESTDGDD